MASTTLYKSETFQIRAHHTFWGGMLAIWFILTLVAGAWLDLTLVEQIIWGFIGMLFHVEAILLHYFGHVWAANRTGYPMSGIYLWMVLGRPVFPKDEPELSNAIHRQRAWGGPIASFLGGIFYLVIALALRSVSPFWWSILLFSFIDNFFVFCLGALMPLGFTDGSTLLRYRER